MDIKLNYATITYFKSYIVVIILVIKRERLMFWNTPIILHPERIRLCIPN